MEALKIYKSLSQPPKSALREIKDGDLKGKTDINPQWRYEAMTEKFGLVGLGWKYEIQKLWTEQGGREEVLCFAQVAVFIRDPDTKEWSDPIVGIGGSRLVNNFKNAGIKSNDEGYKMAVTDAFSTSLKMLGVAADIYAGRWDGSKYKDQEEPAHQNAPRGEKPQQNGPAGGPDTPEERARINELLGAKFLDGSKMFSAKDCQGITNLRATKTAAEVIKIINEEISIRLDAWDKAHPKEPKATEVLKEQLNPDTPVEQDPGYYEMTPEEEQGAGAAFDVF